jgi:hypothetical protein
METTQPSTFVNHSKETDTKPVTVLSGQDLKAGDLLHIYTATASAGKVIKANTATTENVAYYGIAGEDCDATGDDKASWAYTKGEFDEGKITVTGSLTQAIRETLRTLGLRLTTFID